MSEANSPGAPRISTGIAGLDEVLGGGLLRDGIYMVEGPPGAGKTIMCAQISFHLARSGDKVLYVSLISESHGKLLNNLRTLDFFDDAAIPHAIVLMSGYQDLKSRGLSGLLESIARAVAEHRPTMLAIDGYRSIHTLNENQAAIAEFIHELCLLTATAKCLCLLLAPAQESEHWVEKTLMDGVIELYVAPADMRTSRELEVHKLRATAHLQGRHIYTIDKRGITVYPRLEARVTRTAPVPPASNERLRFGSPQLDAMLDGGVFGGTVTCVLGPPGSGKTTLGLQFLDEGARAGEPVLHFGFYESPPALLSKAADAGLQLSAGHDAGVFRVIWQPALEYTLDELADRLLQAIQRNRVRRLFIDGIEGFHQSALMPERLGMFFNALVTELRRMQVTTLFTEETELLTNRLQPKLLMNSAVMESIIALHYVRHAATMHRAIAVLKQRAGAHDRNLREFGIGARGIEVAADSASAVQFLPER